VHGRCRRVGIIDGKLVGAGAQTRRRIEVLDHLKVIDEIGLRVMPISSDDLARFYPAKGPG